MSIKVAPSILSADFSRLGEEIKAVERAGADLLHIDVMDGHFVPNITLGPAIVRSIRAVTRLPLDVHLMIAKPLDFIDAFVMAGSDMLTLHIETVSARAVAGVRRALKEKGIKTGISLNPATPFSKIKPVMNEVDFVLVMTVNPGFGGQAFMPEVIPKISELRSRFSGEISVDGGINEKTGQEAVSAGADMLAAGSYIFNSKDYKRAIRSLQCLK